LGDMEEVCVVVLGPYIARLTAVDVVPGSVYHVPEVGIRKWWVHSATEVCGCERPPWGFRVSQLGVHGSVYGDAQHGRDDVAG
jgi:hypothetical protein